jgi:N-methylhydantoinase B
MTDRIDHPPLGRFGGGSGAANVVRTADGRPVDPKARTELRPGQTLQIRTAGGAGFGPAERRDPALVDRDLAFGYATESDRNS